MRYYSFLETVIGKIYAVKENEYITAIHIGDADFHLKETSDPVYSPDNGLLKECIGQLKEYFAGERKQFNLPIKIDGSKFQTDIWSQLIIIPFGETRSYQEIAEGAGNPKAVRAVGQANKSNRLPIIIPCHRVIGKNKSLTGYAGTRIDIKERLLAIEGVIQP